MSAREAGMGILLVKCPATEKEFSTGVNADRDSLVGLRAVVATSICPHCGAEHAWRLEDARYVDAARSVSADQEEPTHDTLSAREISNESRNH
jgi:hypothetical protein